MPATTPRARASLTGQESASGSAWPMLSKKAEALWLAVPARLDPGREHDAHAHEVDDDDDREQEAHGSLFRRLIEERGRAAAVPGAARRRRAVRRPPQVPGAR
ncbi:MAG TPA: hypothetical protein VEH77_12515 [Roseiarcus sp.]|nr:hypothetical protein [Roseiarcus sp.]